MKKEILPETENAESNNNSNTISGEEMITGKKKPSVNRRDFLVRAGAIGVLAGGVLALPNLLAQKKGREILSGEDL